MSIAPQFRIITGDSPRVLLARLDADHSNAGLSPFDDELIVVQSLGMERWVRQQLAVRRGAAASLNLPFPAAFCRQLATLLQREANGEALDPRFDEQALSWRIAALLGSAKLSGEHRDPVYAPLDTYLNSADESKRYALARRIGARFDEYRLYRPELLLAWERGEDAGPSSPHVPWQAALWRMLTNGESPAHFARWFTETVRYLERVEQAPTGLPPRVSVFGVSTLPPLFVQLLQALARFVPVTCYVLTPSPNGWRDETQRHGLEEAFGQTSRELLAELTAQGAAVEHLHGDLNAAAASLLAELQQAMRSGSRDVRDAIIRVDDHSLLVHDCHSPVRELEVLRDQLLDAFAADPALRPHDVLVMVPDVERYAPFAAIVFGDPHARASGQDADRVAIPYRLADRALARDASAAQALSMVLDLVGSRFPASAVLDLLTLAPVQQAAGIAPAQLDQITDWVRESGIRWGRDGVDRQRLDLPSLEDFTWRQGIDRLLAGYATGRVEALIEGVLPVSGDTVGEAELLGAFADWVDHLFWHVDRLTGARPLAQWSQALQATLDWLVKPDTLAERAAFERVSRELAQLARTAGDQLDVAVDAPVPFDVARRWLANALSADQHDAGFLTGGLTLCAMKPMRAIPFKVIAMLGLDDRAFPRRERRAASDCIEAAPQRGDRNPRADDRQLFLDTLLCAESRLILSWVGRSQQNNAEIAPSVVISELLDLLDAQFRTVSGVKAREHVVVPHALQPFNPAYFDATDRRIFSFDARWARSVAAATQRHEPLPFHEIVNVNLPALDRVKPLVIELSALTEAWTNPARFHCRRVLQLHIPGVEEALLDTEPSRVEPLDKYQLQQRMLERALERSIERDAAPDRAPLPREDDARLTAAAGQLPPGALGPVWYDRLRGEFDDFWTKLANPVFLDPLAVRIDGPGWRLVGQLDGQVHSGQLRVRAARVGVRDIVQGWIAHCAYAAMGGEGVTEVRGLKDDMGFAPLRQDDAVRVLDTLISAYRALLLAPLPYFPEAGNAYWRKVDDREGALQAARTAYGGSEWGKGEIDDPHVALLWRGRDPIMECTADFQRWCEILWAPLRVCASHYTAPAAGV